MSWYVLQCRVGQEREIHCLFEAAPIQRSIISSFFISERTPLAGWRGSLEADYKGYVSGLCLYGE